MSDTNCRSNYNVKSKNHIKKKLSLFIALFALWIGLSKYQKELKFDKKVMWGNNNILLKGGDMKDLQTTLATSFVWPPRIGENFLSNREL
jgi:hypothetical protein